MRDLVTLDAKQFLQRFCRTDANGILGELLPIITLCARKRRADGTLSTPNPERGIILYSIIRHFCLRSYFEIGTSRGFSLACAYRAMQERPRHEKEIVSLDIEPSAIEITKAHLAELGIFCEGNEIRFIRGDSGSALPSNDHQYDIIFVDGDHTKKRIVGDAKWALSHAREFVLFDDYHPRLFPDVVEACDGLRADSNDFWIYIDSDRLIVEPEIHSAMKNDPHGMIMVVRNGSTAWGGKSLWKGRFRI